MRLITAIKIERRIKVVPYAAKPPFLLVLIIILMYWLNYITQSF